MREKGGGGHLERGAIKGQKGERRDKPQHGAKRATKGASRRREPRIELLVSAQDRFPAGGGLKSVPQGTHSCWEKT